MCSANKKKIPDLVCLSGWVKHLIYFPSSLKSFQGSQGRAYLFNSV